MRFIDFGSIEQFRTTVKNITHQAQYVETTPDGPVFDKSVKLPILTAVFSEKIHGTQGAVSYLNGELQVQSRKNIITPLKDNAGCATFVHKNKEAFTKIIIDLIQEYNINSDKIVTVYFEFAGGSIQKSSACTGLDKRAIIFQHFKVSSSDSEKAAKDGAVWLETKAKEKYVDAPKNNIFNIMNLNHGTIEVDFNRPSFAQNKMIEMVNKIEKESKVGKIFGKDGNVGEGFVFTVFYKDSLQRWKVKGEKHSKSKVKTLKKVDIKREQKKIDFVNNFACKSWRLEQIYDETFNIINGGQVIRRGLVIS